MAASDYAKWVHLKQEEPGLSNREYARRLGVSEAVIRRWLSGNIPKGGAEAVAALQSPSRIEREKIATEAQQAQAMPITEMSPEVGELFNAMASTLVPQSFQLVLDAIKQIALAKEDIKDIRDPFDRARARFMFSRNCTLIYESIRKNGGPGLERFTRDFIEGNQDLAGDRLSEILVLFRQSLLPEED